MSELFQRFTGYDRLKPMLEASDEEVLVALRGKPALIRIPGTDPAPRARLVATLLHGNEDSGYRAVLDVLREGTHHPFDLWVFIGNVRAASSDGWFAHRYLDDQEDFNRVWGLEHLTTRMRRCAAEVLEVLGAEADLELALDVHNNTGDNPYYAVLPRWDTEALQLAGTCADTVLLWNLRAHTLMEVLADRCPSIALECGQAGLPQHADFAREAIDRVLSLEPARESALPSRIYEMRARVEVRPEVAFAFGGVLTDELDLVLRPGLDGANFGMMLAGTEIGRVDEGSAMPLCVTDMDGADITERLFAVTADGALLVTEDMTPAMMVTTVRQTRQDCLFYVARNRR